MPQNIQLQHVLIDIVEVKVSCLPSSSYIISRILNRCKIIDIHIIWNNNDTTWVLTCISLNPSSTHSQTINLSITIELIVITFVTLDKTISCPICNSTYRSSTEGILLSKNITYIQVSRRLIIS